MCVCVYVDVHEYVYIYMYMYIYLCVQYVSMCTLCIYVYIIYVTMCTLCEYIHTYIYIYPNTSFERLRLRLLKWNFAKVDPFGRCFTNMHLLLYLHNHILYSCLKVLFTITYQVMIILHRNIVTCDLVYFEYPFLSQCLMACAWHLGKRTASLYF